MICLLKTQQNGNCGTSLGYFDKFRDRIEGKWKQYNGKLIEIPWSFGAKTLKGRI